MSSELVKERRSRRRHDNFTKSIKQARIAKEVGHIEVTEPHRYHKQHALNCGIPNCVMCSNPRRVAKGKERLTMQELRMKINEKEETNGLTGEENTGVIGGRFNQ